jgi:hypothetical protein
MMVPTMLILIATNYAVHVQLDTSAEEFVVLGERLRVLTLSLRAALIGMSR